MRFALDMDNREIARALGRSEGATKVLIHRAIKQLEQGLQEEAPMSDVERVERLLRSALVPVEPPEALTDRLERGLSELTDAAADELADWELSAMRDPRNWARPAAAAVVGGGSPAARWCSCARASSTQAPGQRPARARAQRARRRRRGREAPARGSGRLPERRRRSGAERRRPRDSPRRRSAGAARCPRC